MQTFIVKIAGSGQKPEDIRKAIWAYDTELDLEEITVEPE